MSGLSVSLTGDEELLRELRRASAAVKDLKPAMEEIGHGWRTFADLCFRGESDPWGQTWEQLSEVTLKRRRGTTAQILKDTGRLANSITYAAGADSLALGSDVVYAAAQFLGMKKGYAGQMRNGSPIPWGDIPPRPALPLRPGQVVELPDDWREFAISVLTKHISRAK